MKPHCTALCYHSSLAAGRSNKSVRMKEAEPAPVERREVKVTKVTFNMPVLGTPLNTQDLAQQGHPNFIIQTFAYIRRNPKCTH